MELVKIGIIHSPYKTKEQAPRQGADSEEVCYIEIFEKYIEGLKDIEEARYLIVLYWGHQSSREVLTTLTPFSDVPKGVFACRSPNRPNPILLDIAELIDIKGNVLVVKGIDAIDGSPVIDIKPYYERIDIPKGLKEEIFKVQSK
ncbi:tRNA (N6-threonylcarbamoyladenosine(37)-N6)-methyltransferase TrmO [Caldicellulosiruptor morganii]|uniref:tRNA (N6-threonylcarbamoyladenosine(37)-N6)-methyltransferase TrmO n=1 Tax=Caldicellulosiruptor morganii TaxID=1387555 RepID=A0ABY7BN40_9FIRM|nr:tRNA (N6-threonylcarbamoyladenosine(37)-N6)-methyltransferase TrmO [Caldicellulosiruptor morganii]WAM33989.1 tRNA (N6-threonylcarbamoyladenosine(37)-N6)-methyltransferase TrmO [Caldicellulosiruptor morganii]